MVQCKGNIDSFYHGSALDGSGLRTVIFFSGCNLRCGFCHNPETLYKNGNEYSVEDVMKIISRYENYYDGGGITFSGGEPFLQSEFCLLLLDALKQKKLHIIAETNGTIINEKFIKNLDEIRLDIKNQNGEMYHDLQHRYQNFLSLCQKYGTKVTITNVLIPKLNCSKQNANDLRLLKQNYEIIDNIKILPFHNFCVGKYEKLNIKFPYQDYVPPTNEELEKFKSYLK